MKQKRMEMLFIWLAMWSLFGCAPAPEHAQIADGMVEAIHYGTAQYGMSKVIEGAPSTFIMIKNSLTMLAWSLKENGWAFVVLSTENGINPIDTWEQVTGGTGNLANAKTFSNLVKELEMNGWKVITAASVADAIKTGIATMAVWSTRAMPTFVLMPAALADIGALPEQEFK